jgi:hypothetical protein
MNSNADEKMYKKKYLKYKMKYLSLQRGGLFGNLFRPKEEIKQITDNCTVNGITYVFCIDKYTKEGKDAVTNSKTDGNEYILQINNGKIIFANGTKYNGSLYKGLPHGQGTMKYPNGTVYEGQWKDGKKNGQGTMKYANGNIYKGEWKDNNKNGQGTMEYAKEDGYANSAVYEGEWKDNTQNGQGTMEYANGNHYTGNWQSGYPNGQGKMIYRTLGGVKYEGNFLQGLRDSRVMNDNNSSGIKCWKKGKSTIPFGRNNVEFAYWENDYKKYDDNNKFKEGLGDCKR